MNGILAWEIVIGVFLAIMIILSVALLICKCEKQKRINYVMSIITVDISDSEAV